MSNNKDYKAKRRWKNIGIFVAAILVCTTLLSVIGFGSNGFKESNVSEWFKQERNEDNLITFDKEEDPYLIRLVDGVYENDDGIKIRVSDNGTLKVTGKAEDDLTIAIKNVSLPAGTYTISGVNDSDKYALSVTGSFGEKQAGTKQDTFTLENPESVTVSIFVKEGTFLLNKSFKPCIVEGEDAGDMLK